MARVFISSAVADAELSDEVRGWMIADGHQVFLDRHPRDGIVVGDEWEQRLHERLRWADAVVCVVTAAYRASVWCTAELVTAQNRGSRVLPVWAESGLDHPLLTALQHVDASAERNVVREKLTEALRRIDAAGGTSWPDDRSPFPGLRPFDVELHRVFFGRTREVEQIAELLRAPAARSENAVLMLVGPTGSGKSSLVRAGLIPVMAREPEWLTVPAIVPGTQPVAALARALAAIARERDRDWTPAEVRKRLDAGELVDIADELMSARGSHRTRLLIVVDQFEELLNQTTSSVRTRFVELLDAALAGVVHVVATLRPDFLGPLLADPDLARYAVRVHPVRPLQQAALRTVIERPAQLAGIEVSDDLILRLVGDTAGGEALPLLAFTLAELAEGVRRGERLLDSRYEQLGGVQGALVRQADAALADAAAATGRVPDQVVKELLRLVTVNEHGRPTRLRLKRADLPETVAVQFDAFVARRLLTTDFEQGQVVVGAAHESFLSAWPPLAEKIAAAASALRARHQIERAAADWIDQGRPRARLWERGTLAAALADTGARLRHHSDLDGETASARKRLWPRSNIAAEHVQLNPQGREFLRASIYRERLRRGRTTAILSTLLAFAVMAAGLAIVQQSAAEVAQRLATSRQLLAQADAVLQFGDPRTALQLNLAASRIHPGPETEASLVKNILSTHYSGVLDEHKKGVRAVAFAPTSRTLASAGDDGMVLIWDVSDPTRPHRVSGWIGDRTQVLALAFSPDGRTLVSAGDDEKILLTDVSDPTRPRRLGNLSGHTEEIQTLAFSADGRTLASAGGDQTVMLWEFGDPKHVRSLGKLPMAYTDTIWGLAFSRDHRLATADSSGIVSLWDVANPTLPKYLGNALAGNTASIYAIAFSPDGRTLAGAVGSTVELWDVADPSHPRQLSSPLVSNTASVYAVTFSPDGRTLATARADRRVSLWDVGDPAHPRRLGDPLTGHADQVFALAFSPDGRTLASAGFDHVVLLWSLPDPGWPRRLGAPLADPNGGVLAVAISPDGRTLASAGSSKVVLLWDISDPTSPRRLGDPLAGHTGSIRALAFSPDGRTLASAGRDQKVVLWNTSDPGHVGRLGDTLNGHTDIVYSLAFSPDGRILATAGFDKRVVLWDVNDPGRPRQFGSPLLGHTRGVLRLAFSPDGRVLATAGIDKKVLLWDVNDPAHVRRLGNPLTGHTSGVYALAFSPDGRALATGSADRTVMLWDLTDIAYPRRLGDSLDGHTDFVYTVTFSPDGRTLATGSLDNTVLLWDVRDPGHPHRLGDPLPARTNDVRAAVFTPDGQTLATGGDDRATILYDIGTLADIQAHPLEHACALVRHGLKSDQWDRYVPELPYQNTCSN